MAPAFAALSALQQQLQLRGREAFPYTRIGWDAPNNTVLLTAKHIESNIEVANIPARPDLTSSIGLWWCVLVERLPQVDRTILIEKIDAVSWRTYSELISEIIEFAATASNNQKSEMLQSICTELEDTGAARELRTKSFEELMLVASGDNEVSPKLARLKILWWFAKWDARRRGKELGPATLNYTQAKTPEESEMSKQQWEAEIRRQQSDRRLNFPNILERIQEKRRENQGNPEAEQNPAWFELLKNRAGPENANIYSRLNALAAVPQEDLKRVSAAILTICANNTVDSRSREIIAKATSAEVLASTVRSAWSTSSIEKQNAMTSHFEKLLNHLDEQYATSQLKDQKQEIAMQIAQLTLPPIGDKAAWANISTCIAQSNDCPTEVLDEVVNMRSPQEFLKAMSLIIRMATSERTLEGILRVVTTSLSKVEEDDLSWLEKGLKGPSEIQHLPTLTHPSSTKQP